MAAFFPHPTDHRLVADPEGAGDAPDAHAILIGSDHLVLEALVVTLAFGLQNEGASTLQALGSLVPVLRVAILADGVTAAAPANVDDGRGKHRQPSGLISWQATASLSLPRRIAFDFLICHECTHIAHGHIDYLESKNQLPFLAEFTYGNCADLAYITSQTLEMDADSAAVCSCVSTCLKRLDDYANISPCFKPVYRNRTEALFNSLFAVYSLFRLFGDRPFVWAELGKSYYPPTRARQFMCAVTAMNWLCKIDVSLTPEVAGSLCYSPTVPVEKAFALITGTATKDYAQGLKDSVSAEALAHNSTLFKHWKDYLRDQLLPFTHRKLPD